MSYKQIDEQFMDKYVSKWMIDDGNNRLFWKDKAPTPNEIINIFHLIYDQAKAEQREEDARIAEGKRQPELLGDPAPNEQWKYGFNSACAEIATAIR